MSARGWIDTDPTAIADDLKRLGLDEAAEYQMELIAECTEKDDHRWDDVTLDQMRDALRDIEEQPIASGTIQFHQPFNDHE